MEILPLFSVSSLVEKCIVKGGSVIFSASVNHFNIAIGFEVDIGTNKFPYRLRLTLLISFLSLKIILVALLRILLQGSVNIAIKILSE